MAATYLDTIVAAHRAAAAADRRSLDALLEQAVGLEPTRGFRSALLAAGGMAVISEIKRRSPSKGDLNPDLDPARLAKSYVTGGASCLSVLTDGQFFGGSAHDLQQARSATSVPVLRKDFVVSAHDVVDARLMEADAVLLIVAALDDVELADYYELAVELSLDVLVETHDEVELDRALAMGASMIGVNQRDLVTFQVDHQRAERLGRLIPAEVVAVAESGIGGPGDLAPLARVGYRAVLVGESLVTSDDPAVAVRTLRTANLT